MSNEELSKLLQSDFVACAMSFNGGNAFSNYEAKIVRDWHTSAEKSVKRYVKALLMSIPVEDVYAGPEDYEAGQWKTIAEIKAWRDSKIKELEGEQI